MILTVSFIEYPRLEDVTESIYTDKYHCPFMSTSMDTSVLPTGGRNSLDAEA